jgi:hypothetical protein
MIIELVHFKLADGVEDASFLAEAEKVQKEFLEKQPGFKSREIFKGEGEWVDIVHWETEENANSAAKNFESNPECSTFIEMVDAASVKSSHLEQVRSF